jgi:hypothetical protein
MAAGNQRGATHTTIFLLTGATFACCPDPTDFTGKVYSLVCLPPFVSYLIS